MHEESFFGNPRTWVGLAFILFFVFFGRMLWGALSKLLDDHTAAVQAELDEASRLRREAEAMLRDAEQPRTAAMAEAKALIENAQERMATDRIAAAEKAAMDEVRQTAAEVATIAARQMLAEGLTADADAGLIDHAISALPAALRAA
jgi:F-type H+-transporting ATPase subunit b